MRTKFYLAFCLIAVACSFSACKNTDDETTPSEVSAISTDSEFNGIEELFKDSKFEDPKIIDLLKEINICSDVEVNKSGDVSTPCSPESFKMFPLKKGKDLNEGFILLVKANTGGVALRRVLVFERENGTLVKVNGFVGNLIGLRKNATSYDDLLIRFIDKIEGSDVFYNCIIKWEDGRYVFKTVELIQEPAGDFSGRVREDVKDSVSKDIYNTLVQNQMIF